MDQAVRHDCESDCLTATSIDSFQTASRASLIEQVTGELFAGCNLLTIRGCRGVGKTHLGRQLASLLRAHGMPVIRASGTMHAAGQVQSLIAQAVASSGSGGNRGLRRLVLLVDDAKACPAVLFSYLWSLVARRGAGGPAVQLVLLGDVGPWPGLNDPGLEDLREASTSCYILVPFEEHEAVAYVRHRFAQAGRKRRRLGGRLELHGLAAQSHGVPALLDALVSEALVSEALVRGALVRGERLRPKRGATPERRPAGGEELAGRKRPRPVMAMALACTIAMAVTISASTVAPTPPPRLVPRLAPSSIQLVSSARVPARTVAFAALEPPQTDFVFRSHVAPRENHQLTTSSDPLRSDKSRAVSAAPTALGRATNHAVPAVRDAAGRTGPGLVLVATAGDDMRLLYDKVYRGVTPPPYTAVLAVNRSPVRPGALIIFPEPPRGWSLR